VSAGDSVEAYATEDGSLLWTLDGLQGAFIASPTPVGGGAIVGSSSKGHKVALVLGGLAAASGYVIAGLAALPLLYYLVFVLLGVYFSSTFVSGLMIVLEFTGPEQRPTYVGITNSIIGTINVVIPLLGGWLATISYGYLFALSAAAGLLGVLLMAFWVADPRHIAENA